MANYEWLARFPTDRVKHLNCFTSNHQPIILSLAANGEQQRWRRKPFRFEAMWTLNPACREAIPRLGIVLLRVHLCLKQLGNYRDARKV